MDAKILEEALNQMRGEMRSRVGKKILSIEIVQPDEEDDKEEEEEAPEDAAAEGKKALGLAGMKL